MTTAWHHLPHARGIPSGVSPRAPWHPGRFLSRNYLAPLGLSQSETARMLGVSRRRVHELVLGQREMTPDTAIRCALVFRSDVNFWLALQAAWDGFHAWKHMRQLAGCTPANH